MSSFEDAVEQERQRQAEEAEAKQREDAARDATRLGFINGIIEAAQGLRGYMLTRHIPPQPLHVILEYWPPQGRKKLESETVDSGHKGWRPLGIVQRQTENHTWDAVIGGPFVTTDGFVVLVEDGEPPNERAMRQPAISSISRLSFSGTRDGVFSERPDWVRRRKPAPMGELQDRFFAHAIREYAYGIELSDRWRDTGQILASSAILWTKLST